MHRNMDCIILDDDDDVGPVEKTTSANEKNKSKHFEKRLIREVRKHRIIYDSKHKLFSNVAKKEIVWEGIAKKLKSDVDTCKTTWIELRYKYQGYVRRLRKHFINNPRKNHRKGRPTMSLDSELIYLFRFIDDRKCCSIPFDIVEPVKEKEEKEEEEEVPQSTIIDDDLMLIEQPVELIIIDEDDDNRNAEHFFKVSKDMKDLVQEIKKYPELYDSTQTNFNDYTRKSYLWNVIATTVGDKATKLMKCWILMLTRYEWEISRNLQNTDVAKYQTELQRVLEYFEPFVLANPDTVYKHSYYLKQGWCEPIDYFKEIYNLIVRMKKLPDVVFITDALLTTPEKNDTFFNKWAEIAKMKGSTAGQCETTWLIMRLFYWELMNMRQQNYQLTDKWYFESIITELYDLARESQVSQRQRELKQLQRQRHQPPDKSVTVTKKRFSYLSNASNKFVEKAKSPNNTSQSQNVLPNSAAAPAAKSAQANQTTSVQLPLPKISCAVSLAPQVVTSGVVVNGSTPIRPLPPTHSNVAQTKSTPQQQTQLSTVTLPTSASKESPITVANSKKSASNLKSNPKPARRTQGDRKTASQPQKSLNTSDVPQSSPAPMVCINTPIKHPSTISSVAMSLPQTPVTSTTAIASTISLTEAPSAQTSLPKISSAISLLNPNEILIELIASQNGNHLVVHGPPLSEKYHLSMPTVAKFIRQVLAIPLLHNKRHSQPSDLIKGYWDHISKTCNLPAHICRACWNFLVENFNHFPQIAPLKELMKPFTTTLKVWTESIELFKIFDQHAVSNGWLAYMSTLPDIVECIGTYPILYKDVSKNATDTASDMESLCVLRTINLRFPNISDIGTIWTALKNIFCQYMSDLEFGIDNKWHIHWWRVLARMKFLVETRYSTNEPFYYIVSNKMMEEIERCAMIEMKSRYGKNEDVKGNVPASATATAPTKKVPSAPSTSKAVDENVQLNSCPKQQVEMVTLLMAIEKYPIIYEKADCLQKFEAWKNVAKELQMDVSACLLAFRGACQKYFAYKKQDAFSRCNLNKKYFKRFENIFHSVKPIGRRKLNIKTPFELNQSVDTRDTTATTSSADFIFPERFISDINMSNCDSDLVVKNWIYAFGNMPNAGPSNDTIHSQLKTILAKYLPSTVSRTK